MSGAEVASVLVASALVTMRTDLNQASTGDRAGTRRGPGKLHLRVVGFPLSIRAAVEQT